MSAALRVLLVGAQGRMGQAVAAAIGRDSGLTIAGGIHRDDAIAAVIDQCDVVIDFSVADASTEIAQACAEHRKPLVIGTTGQSAAQKESLATASGRVPIVFAANFSAGVNVLFALTRRATEWLGDGFDVNVIEMHHRTKKDAPSGTAKRLLEILREVRAEGSDIAVQSIRAGDMVGEHTVIFSGRGERLELTHRAESRQTFAVGALRAACWVVRQSPGLYKMEDVLGL
ncbi:MAG TPA: 4-hydroxy-tetrahydrodipicolinate reductase [Chthoniobacterales bacterium]